MTILIKKYTAGMDRTSNIDTSSTTNTNYIEIQSEEPNNKTLTMRKSSVPLNGSCLDGNVQHIHEPQQPQQPQPQHDEDSLFFVNKGLELWEKGRQEWLTQANPSNHHNNYNHNNHNHNGGNSNGGGGGVHKGAIDLNIDDVIDCIVSNRWRTALKGAKDKGTFATPVPLPQMIDILTDLWEAEGLDN